MAGLGFRWLGKALRRGGAHVGAGRTFGILEKCRGNSSTARACGYYLRLVQDIFAISYRSQCANMDGVACRLRRVSCWLRADLGRLRWHCRCIRRIYEFKFYACGLVFNKPRDVSCRNSSCSSMEDGRLVGPRPLSPPIPRRAMAAGSYFREARSAIVSDWTWIVRGAKNFLQ